MPEQNIIRVEWRECAHREKACICARTMDI